MWMISIIALWVLVLFETVLLVLLLRALGQIKQQGGFANKQSSSEWGLPTGEKAPLFNARDQKGQMIRLRDLRGQKCLLAFVSSGCVPCVETMEMLNAFLQEKSDVAVLVIAGTDVSQNRAFANEYHAEMPVLTPDAEVGDAFRVTVRPFAFVLDEDGVIRAKGPLNYRELLDALLKKAFPVHPIAREVIL